MIYMLIFWLVLGISLILYFIFKRIRIRSDDIPLGLALLALAFLIVGIVTRDPLFSLFGVPLEFEWVVGLFITAFTSWKLYFDPMKKRMARTERDVISIKTDVRAIKNDISLIKGVLIK